jgi:hypothetical protein
MAIGNRPVAHPVTAALRREDVGRLLAIGGQLPAAVRPARANRIAWLAASIPAE